MELLSLSSQRDEVFTRVVVRIADQQVSREVNMWKNIANGFKYMNIRSYALNKQTDVQSAGEAAGFLHRLCEDSWENWMVFVRYGHLHSVQGEISFCGVKTAKMFKHMPKRKIVILQS